MSTLTGQQIKDTYDGLLKTQNSTVGIPSSGVTRIEDGVGNDSALKLGRTGNGAQIDSDFSVDGNTSLNAELQVDDFANFDGDVEFQQQVTMYDNLGVQGDADLGTLKIGGNTPEINKFVDEADGIANNDNDTSLPTSAAVKDYVDSATPTITKYQHMHGMVNNLASQGSGGYDYMEWTSNATPEAQVPAIVALQDLKLIKVGAVWLGSSALSLQTNEQVAFTLRKLTAGSSSVIGNYTSLGSLFTIDQTDSGTFYNANITLSTPINVSAGDIIACVGQEAGTVTPNSGELAISFLFEEV